MAKASYVMALCLSVCILGVLSANYERYTTNCSPASYWSGQTCLRCKQSCSCNSYMGCDGPISCPEGQAQKSLENGGFQCLNCPTGCEQCTVEGKNGFKCQKCKFGYDDIQNLCVSMNSFSGPTVTYRQIWGAPQSYLKVSGKQGLCKDIDDDTGMCKECLQSSQFLNEYGFCEQCPTKCAKCNARGTCENCMEGYSWNVTATSTPSCQSVPVNATIGFICQLGCKTCTSATQCTQCIDGFYLNAGVCTPCPGNQVGAQLCKTCSNTACTACFNSTDFLVGGQCKSCSGTNANCAQCELVTVNNAQSISCQTCQNEYYRVLQQDNIAICKPCNGLNQNALYCEQNDNNQAGTQVKITQCKKNFYLVPNVGNTTQNVCVTNPNSCLQIKDSSQNCTSCLPESVLLTNGKCSGCPNGCASGCAANGTNAVCGQCNEGYFLSTDKTSCTQCAAGCSKCTNSTTCTACYPGNRMNNGQCQPCGVANCQTCNTIATTCELCNNNYFLYGTGANQQCLMCPPGCADCVASLGAKCTACQPGYYQMGDGCYMGSLHCAVLNSDGSCQLCQYGTYLLNGNCYPCVNIGQSYICGENAGFTSCFGSYLNSLFLILAIMSIYFFQ